MSKKFENTYRPLPTNCTIKESKINGLGLFATEKIPINYNFGITHHWLDEECIRTPLGGFLNHSENPNAFIIDDGDVRTMFSVREIKKDEEILVYYKLY
jgi:SET domain-containing protein